jgi:hypothetical protein
LMLHCPFNCGSKITSQHGLLFIIQFHRKKDF